MLAFSVYILLDLVFLLISCQKLLLKITPIKKSYVRANGSPFMKKVLKRQLRKDQNLGRLFLKKNACNSSCEE